MAVVKHSYNRKIVVAYLCTFGIPEPVFEHKFHKDRDWRFDLAWPASKLALEVQGGIWTHGSHVRGAHLLKEWEKLNEAAVLGWRILYCQPKDLCIKETAVLVKEALKL